MRKDDVVLLGYYGRSNFGDDILMVVTHRIIRELLPKVKISIRLARSTPYVSRLTEENIGFIPFGDRNQHRLIIHGGGGTFFDFAQHSMSRKIINTILLSAGSTTFVKCEKWIRRVVKRPRMSAQRRIGIGLGIGTFTFGSPKLLEALPILADFNILWLRDQQSQSNLKRLAIHPPVILGSDIAFFYNYWCPSHLVLAKQPKGGSRPKVGVILRDWPVGSGDHFAKKIAPTLHLLSQNYELTLISFDQSTDEGTLKFFRNYPEITWQPDKMTISEFANILSEQDLFLTARAHGAICGACLGRPSVILEIEPKLATINSMLPNTTRIARLDIQPEVLVDYIEEVRAISPIIIENEVLENHKICQGALNQIRSHIEL